MKIFKILCLSIGFLSAIEAYAYTLTGQTSNLCQGSTYSYSFFDDAVTYSSSVWSAAGTVTGTGNNRNITWTSTGSSTLTIYLYQNSTLKATRTFSISVLLGSGLISVSGTSAFCTSGTVNLSHGAWSGTKTWYYDYSDNNGTSWHGATSFSTAQTGTNSFAVTSASVDRIYKFWCSVSGSCGTSNTNMAMAYVYYAAPGSVSPASLEGYGSVSITLTANGSGSVSSWQKSTDGGTTWANIPNTNFSTYAVNSDTSSTKYRATVIYYACTYQTTPASVIVDKNPSFSSSLLTPGLPIGGTLTLTSSTPTATYTWYRNDTLLASGSSVNSITINRPNDTYKLKVTSSSGLSKTTTTGYRVYALGQAANTPYNAQVTTTIRKAGVTTSTYLYSTAITPDQYTQTVRYKDGLFRPLQDIVVGKSLLGRDIVQPYAFDSQGLQTTSYLPYVDSKFDGQVKTKAISNSGNYATSDQYLFYQPGGKVASSIAPYSKVVLEASPLARVLEKGAAGTDWQPVPNDTTTHTVKQEFHINPASSVMILTTAGKVGFYAAGQLGMSITKDENNNRVYEFTDKLGRKILKRVQAEETIATTFTPYLETYYIYDDRGNLVYQVPPSASVKLLNNVAWSTVRTALCFAYTYDLRNRLIKKKVPDAAPEYYAYDPLGRQVLVQNSNLKTLKKWIFTKYDIKGRVIMTGLYYNPTDTTVQAIQTLLDGLYSASNPTYPANSYFEDRGATLHGYTNISFPKINSDNSAIEPLAVKYYDNYDLDNNGTDDVSYTVQTLPNEGSQGNAFGLATSSKRLVVGTANWLIAHTFYDAFGKVIQVRSNNHLSLAVDNLTTIVYDFEGKVLQTKRYHNAGGTNQTTVINKTTYDIAGRPTLIYQNINNAPTDQLVAKYTYNELGQLIEKNLHESSPGQFIQSVDYRYNIRGWLSSINNGQLTSDGVTNDDTNDFFGMELLYNTADASSMGNQPYFNGNISAIKWKGIATAPSGAAGQRSYKFNYSKVDRLLSATYQKNGGTTWNQESGNLNETQNYDHNGNIQGLQRNQILRTNLNTTSSQAIDNLTYSYTNTTNGNRLTKVEDAVADTTLGGFINRATATNEFAYAKDGSMTADNNKKISSIVYNILGKPQQMIFSNGLRIDYTYDAAGSKLTMKTYKSNVLQTSTDYVDGFVYESGALSFMSSPEGRVVKNGSAFEYQYAIADHQGNTRLVFSSVTPATSTYTATFEDNTLATETATFQNYPTGATRSSNDLFDHTDFAGTVYTRSNFLNGGYNSQVGLSKSIKVYPGDVIHAEVYAKFWNQSSTNSNLTAFASALTAAFGVSAGSVGEGLKAYNALNNFGAGIVAAGGSGNTLGPKAFITVLLYDKNYNFVDVTYKQINPSAVQTGTGTKSPDDYMFVDKTVVEPGYAFIYISNEDPHLVDVYFDDLTITQTKTKVIQYNEYYPFGLQTQNSWTRENSTGNNFLANGATELNLTSSLYDLTYRNYDPILGRFGQVDPLADNYGSHTPYNYAFNSPEVFVDPSGAAPGDDCISCGFAYGTTEFFKWIKNYITGRPAQRDDGWNPNSKGPTYDAATGTYGLAQMYLGEYGHWYNQYTDWYVNGKLVDSQLTGKKFKPLDQDKSQNNGKVPGDLSWFERNFKDISNSNYPGVKIYETSLIADGTAVTLPGMGILIHPNIRGTSKTKVLQHEYGHFLDYNFAPDLNISTPGAPGIPIVNFYLMIGVPSIINAGTGLGGDHGSFWTEVRANQWAEVWFGGNYIRDQVDYPTK